MFQGFDDPGPCPVCGAAHSACVGDRDSAGIGVTRGVIVIQQLPARDGSTSPSEEQPATEPAPETAPAPVRTRRARPIRRPAAAERTAATTPTPKE